jgi:hypothetical protein
LIISALFLAFRVPLVLMVLLVFLVLLVLMAQQVPRARSV